MFRLYGLLQSRPDTSAEQHLSVQRDSECFSSSSLCVVLSCSVVTNCSQLHQHVSKFGWRILPEIVPFYLWRKVKLEPSLSRGTVPVATCTLETHEHVQVLHSLTQQSSSPVCAGTFSLHGLIKDDLWFEICWFERSGFFCVLLWHLFCSVFAGLI